MIEYIKGELAEVTPASAVVECGGVGYMLNISLNTYTRLQNERQAKVYVYEAIREDAHVLYGFADREERALFLLLITVSGVGPNTARMILSSFSVADLQGVIASGNVNLLKAVKGIGAKTAQRIIVDLRDKINQGGDTFIIQSEMKSEVYEEAQAALVMLGFPKAAVQKALGKLLKENPEEKVEGLIKKALKIL